MRHDELILELLENTEFRKSFNSHKSRLRFLISTMLIQARKKQKITQHQLAERLGTTQSSIARLESGEVWPKLEFLKRIADVYETDLLPPRFEFLEAPFGKIMSEVRMLTQRWEIKDSGYNLLHLAKFQTNSEKSGNEKLLTIER